MRYLLIIFLLLAGIAGAEVVVRTVAAQPEVVVCGRTCIG